MRTRSIVGAQIVLAALSLSTMAGATSTGITVETCSQYTYGCGVPVGSGFNVSGEQFLSGMLSVSGTPFYQSTWWNDESSPDVYGTDFVDPDATGRSSDDDTDTFDKLGDAISFYAGHGVCDAEGDTGQYCTSAADCTSPPSGTSMPAVCRRWPGDSFGGCSYVTPYRFFVSSNCSAGYGGTVNYSSGIVRFGESLDSDSWAGAGTNGGVNLVEISASCAASPDRPAELVPLFAGIHLLAITAVHTGDTAVDSTWNTRGGNFAARYAANPSGQVGTAWLDALSDSDYRNDWCQNSEGTASYGGGFGFNGCGQHQAMAADYSRTVTNNHLRETWSNMTDDSRDAQGSGWALTMRSCNWDCATWTTKL